VRGLDREGRVASPRFAVTFPLFRRVRAVSVRVGDSAMPVAVHRAHSPDAILPAVHLEAEVDASAVGAPIDVSVEFAD
jgi:hypothetical protein